MDAEHAAARANASSNRNGSVIVIPFGDLTGKLEIRYAQWDIGRGLKVGYIATEVYIVSRRFRLLTTRFLPARRIAAAISENWSHRSFSNTSR